ncbi:Probable carboxylesterase 2 [Striga hermonthica]|uniref:Probable carboxylesterase 2 n=1 Tax=Striga hermonthica TaxID=68872 RepID=A0A9N7ME14_STRHE|nr:Probable carboxylesterase 2 [Striga hermonthica]
MASAPKEIAVDMSPFFRLFKDGSIERLSPPQFQPPIGGMAGRRVMFFVAEKDLLRDRAWGYYEGLRKSAWAGEAEIMETREEGHCFHLFNSSSDKAVAIMDRGQLLHSSAYSRCCTFRVPTEFIS